MQYYSHKKTFAQDMHIAQDKRAEKKCTVSLAKRFHANPQQKRLPCNKQATMFMLKIKQSLAVLVRETGFEHLNLNADRKGLLC